MDITALVTQLTKRQSMAEFNKNLEICAQEIQTNGELEDNSIVLMNGLYEVLESSLNDDKAHPEKPFLALKALLVFRDAMTDVDQQSRADEVLLNFCREAPHKTKNDYVLSLARGTVSSSGQQQKLEK